MTTILVVDDDRKITDMLRRTLTYEGYRVATAADGHEALAKAQAEKPDLVVLDWLMPGLNGIEVAQRLRTAGDLLNLMLTARDAIDDRVTGLDSGADDYLVKPFSARELIARVTTHLEMAEIRRQMATHHLVEDDLRRSVTMRNEFLTLAAHELRTPLATLRLQNEQLQRIVASSEASDANAQIVAGIDRVAKQTARLEQLVENLLDASALTVSDTEQSCETLDLRDVARDVIERLAGGASRQHGSIEFSGHSVVGYWDRSRLERLLTALITNSLKFAPGYPVNVRLDEEKGRARLLVSDRGIGIAPEDQQRIFDRFERAVSSDHYGGLGLGLWIVRQMVESMGGAIQVQSEVDSGATFIVELPVRPAR
jgi:signal transduction histidine kinase